MSSVRSNPSERYPPYTGSGFTSHGSSTIRRSNMNPPHRVEATGATMASGKDTSGLPTANGANTPNPAPPMSNGGHSTTPQETEAMRQAILGLVNVWLSRMSLMSGITTFFAGIDGQLLSYAYPSAVTDTTTDVGYRIAVASLAGAMVLHWMAAIITYMACFALYRYELIDARHEEANNGISAFRYPSKSTAQLLSLPLMPPPLNSPYISIARVHPLTFSKSPADVDGNAHVEVPPSTHGIPKLPMNLTSVNDACVGITFAGFVLAIIGILAYIWAFLPSYVSIFSSICLGVSFFIGLWVLR